MQVCFPFLEDQNCTQKKHLRAILIYGIMPMNVQGEIFDPNFHRVVQEVEDETKPVGTIVAELQKGYMIQGRLLREAMVVVAKSKK